MDTISLSPPIAPNHDSAEWKAQFSLSWPISCAMILRRLVDIISLIFVGHLQHVKGGDGANFLAGAGLAVVTANVTGFSLIIGISGALGTVSGIAYGANDSKTLVLSLQRMIWNCFILCIPISI